MNKAFTLALFFSTTPVVFADAPKETSMDLVVQQSTQASFDGTMVGVARIGHDEEYKLPDGTTRKGIIARISIANGPNLTVGAGSAFEIGAHRYEVVAVADVTPRGTVTFRRVH